MTAPRLQGLDHDTTRQVIAAAQALAMGRVDQAETQLRPALRGSPNHPEVLRLHAGILNLRGDYPAALAAMQRAVELQPMDALYHNTLGTILGTSGDFDAAICALHRACEIEPGLAVAWYNLGIMLVRCVHYEEAADALQRAVELAPDNMDARAQLGDMLRMRGDVQESAAQYRRILSEHSWAGMAWWGLADLRTNAFAPDDIGHMRAALRDSRARDDDRIAIGFALATALDQEGRYDESLGALERANDLARLRQHWNAAEWSALNESIRRIFTPPPAGTEDGSLGHGVIFIVGMPRSGTTLAEQILASHSEVEGAGELPDMPRVLADESRRRGHAFPQWVAQMYPADWRRLGERYLERTAYWRRKRPVFTDKLLNNWMYIGAIRAMLPSAHIVVCRRDPLETCFSCYRQRLANNEYTRTFEDLAAFWRDFDRTTTHFAALHSAHVYQHDYEALVSNPAHGIRRLLDACGLAFEDACLRFYETDREVRSPSATQVRARLRTDTAHTRRYGNRLDPLRAALGLPLFDA